MLKQELEIINFIKDKLSDLIAYKDENHPETIFYRNSEDKWVLEQDNLNDTLWVKYKDFWSVLGIKYSMKFKDIQLVIKYMVEQKFKIKVSMPYLHELKNKNN